MPMISGYRSLARLHDGRDYGFELDLDFGSLSPGERGPGQLSFWEVAELPELTEGQEFEVREGQKVVGWGTLLGPQGKDPVAATDSE